MNRHLPALLLALSACSPSGVRDTPRGTDRDAARAATPSAAGRLPGDSIAVDAVPAILAAYDRFDVVGMGILSYANQDLDQFILDLVRHPGFPARVNDIVVECGNSLYQPVLDRYIAGEEVPFTEAQLAWRNTTQPMCGLAGFYEQLFPLVRRINQRLPAEARLRVLAGDPPVNWAQVRSPADLRPFMNRDESIAAVMEREVLSRGRKALMIFGIRHLVHGGGGAVSMYERAGYAHRTFVIMAHNGFVMGALPSQEGDSLESRMAAWPVPSLVALQATWLGKLHLSDVLPGGEGSRRLAAAVDGYLYLGPGNLLLNEPIPARLALDTAYMTELQRRAELRGNPAGFADVMEEVTEPDIFFRHPAGQGPARERGARP